MTHESLCSWERGFDELADSSLDGVATAYVFNEDSRSAKLILDLSDTETRAPVRLRMMSYDVLCRRSMEVSWDDGESERHSWSSWSDPLCGWFEAEKILGSRARNILVRFSVQTVLSTQPVCMVDRQQNCCWVYKDGKHQPEEFLFSGDEGVDAAFELSGPSTHCYVWRAWNAGDPNLDAPAPAAPELEAPQVGESHKASGDAVEAAREGVTETVDDCVAAVSHKASGGSSSEVFDASGPASGEASGDASNKASGEASGADSGESSCNASGEVFREALRVEAAVRAEVPPGHPWRWDDNASRPKRCKPEVLIAADGVAGHRAQQDPVLDCARATERLVAAVCALHEVRRKTCKLLKVVDESLTGQWLAVNSANTMSAGLGVAAAVSLFMAPPISFSLVVGSALVGGGAGAGDAIGDVMTNGDMRDQLSCEAWNTFAVAEIEHEWLAARQKAAKLQISVVEPGAACDASHLRPAYGAQLATATVAKVLVDAIGETRAASSAVVAAEAAAPVAAKALGVLGAAMSVGIAIHGWSTTKSLQATVRRKIEDLISASQRTSGWLSAMGRLECTICRCGVHMSQEAGCCQEAWHYFHARCLDMWVGECTSQGLPVSCPCCRSPLSDERGILEDLSRPAEVHEPAPGTGSNESQGLEASVRLAGGI